jgi:integrase
MAVHKNKKTGRFEVQIYDPRKGRMVYVGTRPLERDAKKLFRQKTDELATEAPRFVTFDAYAQTWLDLHHGSGTRRPSPSTRAHNEQMLRAFLRDYGARKLDGITRGEALAWARSHPHNAKDDAIDDEACAANPFRNRRQEQPRGRQDIYPLTEDEVDRLADCALRHWGSAGYGRVARAWVLFGAWVGSRPGETFAVTMADLDFKGGLVRVTRVKGRKQTEWVVLPQAVQDAIEGMPAPARGPIFPTVTGRRMDTKGALHYAWSPVRAAFKATVTPERWAELLNGSEGRDLPFYALRHFAASIIVDRGGNEYEVAAQLGNSPEVARDRYVHTFRERANERNRARLDGEGVVDLAAARERKGA